MEYIKKKPRLCVDEQCTGCMACVNACNNDALTISTNNEGFYRPILNNEKCVNCGLCENSCPVLNSREKSNASFIKVYAAWHLNDTIRLQSSSGGAFTALAETVLKNGGVVFGAAWNEQLLIEHIEVTELDGLASLRRSKYAQSLIGDAMKRVKQRLEDGKEVLFVGTPCQVAGLRRYLRKDYERLTIIDFICHGVPSISFLQTYLKWLEAKTGKVDTIVFRDKRKGWYDSLRVVNNTKGREIVLRGKKDCYWVSFNNNNNSLQKSCYQCVVQSIPSYSDITIADFWGVGQKIPFGHLDDVEKGVSLVITNNWKGDKMIEAAKDNLYLEERTLGEAFDGNVTAIHSCARPTSRDTFYQDLGTMEFDSFRKKYMDTTYRQDAVKFCREYLPSSLVKYIRLRKQK